VLATADEVFLTSSTRDVHPVAQVDGRPLPGPGPVTEKAMAAFADLTASTSDP
jgi:branched-chain amino acid aminotransferase